MDAEETGRNGVDWIHLALDRGNYRAVLNAVMTSESHTMRNSSGQTTTQRIPVFSNMTLRRWGSGFRRVDGTCCVHSQGSSGPGRKLLPCQVRRQGVANYVLTPWSRVRLEKLTGFWLLNKFPAFYGTRRFIIAFTCARHLPLS